MGTNRYQIKHYQHSINSGILQILVLFFVLLLPTVGFAQDSDEDGVDDTLDNCIEISNPQQLNTDGDQFGNRCDADFDNSGFVNLDDFDLFVSFFGTANVHADLDSSGFVNLDDFDIFTGLFGKPAGGAENISKAEASRFLTQSTFGPTLTDINHLVELGSYEAWLNEQILEPTTLQLPAMRSLAVTMCEAENTTIPPVTGGSSLAKSQIWWETAVNANDQLRQRVALALSEILVVSGQGALTNSQYGLADYYDVLANNAFGNFRDLLTEVTLHPVMGRYLSMLRNEKADPIQNIRPDENYAREIMQLFTIGVHQLNIDGSLVLDAQGKPVPTYGQHEVEEFAKVFTGWDFANSLAWNDLWIGNGDMVHPMKAWEQLHDTGDKHLLNGFLISAGGTARQDLDEALNNLFDHQNIAPFISKQLIQRLVTSNPTNKYVERVARVFNNNGANVKGDLKAVVKAILLDEDARNGHQTIAESFGKLREPMLRITHLWRAFPVIPKVLEGAFYGGETCGQGEYEYYKMPFNGGLSNFDETLGQTILRSPTVFNFYMPDYSPPGIVREQKLVAPEFQIMTENTLINTFNAIISMTFGDIRNTTIDITQELALVDNSNELLDHLNLVLLNNAMSPGLRQILLNHLGQTFSAGDEGKKDKVRDTIKLILTSPEYLIQQ